jgi:hypothetical protein
MLLAARVHTPVKEDLMLPAERQAQIRENRLCRLQVASVLTGVPVPELHSSTASERVRSSIQARLMTNASGKRGSASLF